MAMDFFEQQQAARRRSVWLTALFAAALAAIILAVYVVVSFLFDQVHAYHARMDDPRPPFWNLPLLGITAGSVLALVLGASAFRTAALRAGGEAIAESLGGRRIEAGTRDAHERQLLNVVEEMALASGTPVPPVYVMDNELTINAFAAGHSVSDAVVGVTRGCLRRLSRDELQGVIAHEFSHILNGDMRMNLRLVGLVFGILVLGLMGRALLYSLRYVRPTRSRRSGKGGGEGGVILAILVLGAALVFIGYVGTFFGNLIKAAVSRQREYLADASAVQFTRNPGGIAGALKKIGGLRTGGLILNPAAGEVSHMFFAQSFHSFLGRMFATHPPLPDRVRRIDPTFDGQFPKLVDATADAAEAPGRASLAGAAEQAGAATADGAPIGRPSAGSLALAAAVQTVGMMSRDHVDYARRLLEALPDRLREAAGCAFSARAVVYAMLLSDDEEVCARQRRGLFERTDQATVRETDAMAVLLKQIPPEARLPLIDLALPALRELSPAQFEDFERDLRILIAADHNIDLFEWLLQHIVRRHLRAHFAPSPSTSVHYHALRPLSSQCVCLLSTLAHAGHANQGAAQAAFRQASRDLGLEDEEMLDSEQCTLAALDEALQKLDRASPAIKRRIMRACAVSIGHDHKVTTEEAELFRAFADALGCPIPPVLPGQTV